MHWLYSLECSALVELHVCGVGAVVVVAVVGVLSVSNVHLWTEFDIWRGVLLLGGSVWLLWPA